MISPRLVLGEIIVGAGFEAGEDVLVVPLDRQHQDRQARADRVGPDRPADGVAVGVGQVHVEDHDMRPDLAGLGDRVEAPGKLVDREPGAAEDRAE